MKDSREDSNISAELTEVRHRLESLEKIQTSLEYGIPVSDIHTPYKRCVGGRISRAIERVLPRPSLDYYEIDSSAVHERHRRYGFWHHAAAAVLLVITIALVVMLATVFPWMTHSIASLVVLPFMPTATPTSLAFSGGAIMGIVYILIAIAIAVGHTFFHRKMRLFWQHIGFSEEQYFRTGAEGWTSRQRVVACVMFGVAHWFNVIYPLSVVVALMVTGALFMVVYLMVYRKTQNNYIATAEAAKLHALYDEYAMWLFAVMLALRGVIMLFGLV